MSDSAKTIVTVVAMVMAMEVLKRIFGAGVSLAVAMSALAFCIGALWSAGKSIEDHPKERDHD